MRSLIVGSILCTVLGAGAASAQSVDKGVLLERYGLVDDAKREYIEVIFTGRLTRAQRARAWHKLAILSFEVGDLEGARFAFQKVMQRYPDMALARDAKKRLAALQRELDDPNDRTPEPATRKTKRRATKAAKKDPSQIEGDGVMLAAPAYFDVGSAAPKSKPDASPPSADKAAAEDMMLADDYF